MKKASDILVLIGYVFAIILGLLSLFMTVVSIIITTPASDEIIRNGINNGSITVNIPGTIEEKIAYVHRMFIVVSIVCFIASATLITSAVFAFLGKKKDSKFDLVALILAAVSGNALLIVGEALSIAANKRE